MGTPGELRRDKPGTFVHRFKAECKTEAHNDFLWGIELKETHTVIGMIEVFDVENERSGMIGFRIDPRLWNEGICTESMKRVVDFIIRRMKEGDQIMKYRYEGYTRYKTEEV